MRDDPAGLSYCVGPSSAPAISRCAVARSRASSGVFMPSPPSFSLTRCIVEPVVALNQGKVFPRCANSSRWCFNVQSSSSANPG